MNQSLDELGAEAMLAIRRYVEALVARELARRQPWVGEDFEDAACGGGIWDRGNGAPKRPVERSPMT
jgi:hypothetical protein